MWVPFNDTNIFNRIYVPPAVAQLGHDKQPVDHHGDAGSLANTITVVDPEYII